MPANRHGINRNGIDDVLAAIRMLVMPPQICDMRAGAPGKLVLDPAQRVGSPSGSPDMKPPDMHNSAAPFALAKSVPESGADGEDEVEEIVLDEEALRGLVAKVLRDELQGEFGDRVSRNIRRLVQREVRLALSRLGLD